MKKQQNTKPSCACGKGDLYEEWLKRKEQQPKDITTPSTEEVSDKKSGEEGVDKD